MTLNLRPPTPTPHQGREFVNKANLCLFNTEHRISSAYHPQTSGLVERFNEPCRDIMWMTTRMTGMSCWMVCYLLIELRNRSQHNFLSCIVSELTFAITLISQLWCSHAYKHLMWLKDCFIALPVISSEIILLHLDIILYKNSETDLVLLSGSASASDHFEKKINQGNNETITMLGLW